MRILYGVQGTGNGHLARARVFAPALARAGHEVDWLFSGRDPSGYFDLEAFGAARHLRGLGLVVRHGRIDRLATARRIRPLRLARELLDVRPERYDLVVSDYEPLSAWAGKLEGVPVVGIGHQQAFAGTDADGCVPEPDGDRLGRAVLRRFAPADVGLGMHWARFRPTILPPVVDTSLALADDEGFTLVYRPFESSRTLVAELNRVERTRFELFAPDVRDRERVGNVLLRPCSHGVFRERLVRASGVMCSTGFELVSEALHLGLPVLTRPLPGQHEQQANALALRELGLARVHRGPLNPVLMERFLAEPRGARARRWPDVAGAVVEALGAGAGLDAEALSARLWRSAAALADPSTDASTDARLDGGVDASAGVAEVLPGRRPDPPRPAALAAG